ncbi:MAG: hypothetical protein RR197_03055 [Oscillospiraceae bacterium]
MGKYDRCNAVSGVFELFVNESALPAKEVAQRDPVVKNKFSMRVRLPDRDDDRVLFGAFAPSAQQREEAAS